MNERARLASEATLLFPSSFQSAPREMENNFYFKGSRYFQWFLTRETF
jgi:hypothetical protein